MCYKQQYSQEQKQREEKSKNKKQTNRKLTRQEFFPFTVAQSHSTRLVKLLVKLKVAYNSMELAKAKHHEQDRQMHVIFASTFAVGGMPLISQQHDDLNML